MRIGAFMALVSDDVGTHDSVVSVSQLSVGYELLCHRHVYRLNLSKQ